MFLKYLHSLNLRAFKQRLLREFPLPLALTISLTQELSRELKTVVEGK